MAKRTKLVVSGDDEVEAPAIAEIEKKPKLSGSVTVACKIPQGLILQLQHKQRIPVPRGITGGSNDYMLEEQWVFGGQRIHVFGPSVPAAGGQPDGYILPHAIEGGYALTRGIPAAFWAEWLEQNKQADYVKNGMIFAMDPASTVAKASERSTQTSGLEPLSREADANGILKDRRVPKSVNASVGRLAFDADRSAARASGTE